MKRSFICIALIATACTTQVDDIGSSAQASEFTRADGDRVVGQCSDPGSNVISKFTSTADVAARLVGVWMRCDGPTLAPASDEVGIEVRPDGRWFALRYTSNGKLARGTGFSYEGTWEVIDTSVMNGPGAFQVNWNMASGGLPSRVAFTEAPVKLQVSSYSNRTFVRLSEKPLDLPETEATGSCSEPGQNVQSKFSSMDELKGKLVGLWLRCEGDNLYSAGDGIELDPDGTWYGLKQGANGSLARAGGTAQGTWSLQDTSAMNGPGVYAVELGRPGSSLGCFPSLTSNPTKLRLGCETSNPPTFVYRGKAP